MLGKDFFVYWQIGRALLAGLNPYSVNESFYPPATTLLFAPLALLPSWLAFPLWTGANVALLVHTLRRLHLGRAGLVWMLFSPVVFVLMTGQMDLIFVWLATFLLVDGPVAAVAGALITLKPQAALVVLPWILLRWVSKRPKTTVQWMFMTAGLHVLPFLVPGGLYVAWWTSIQGQAGWRLLASPGLFSLTSVGISWPILIPVALAVAVWGLIRSKELSIASQLFALPMGLWYEDVLLIGAAPWQLLVPVSWLAFAAAAATRSSLPLAAITAFAWGWLVVRSFRGRGRVPAPAVESP